MEARRRRTGRYAPRVLAVEWPVGDDVQQPGAEQGQDEQKQRRRERGCGVEPDRDRGVELRVKTEDGAEVQHRRIAVDRPAEPVKKNPAHRHSPDLATELLRASGRQDPMAASNMKDADQDPRDDSYIRQVEHGPESEIDEIYDPAAPQAVQEVAAGSPERRAQGNGRNRTLEQQARAGRRQRGE